MKRSKILIVLFRVPYPAVDGTRYKILDNVVGGLVKDFDIEFCIITTEKYSPFHIEYLERNFGKVHIFRQSFLTFVSKVGSGFFSTLPLQSKAFLNPSAKKWLNIHVAEYDSVYIHEIRLTEYFIHLPLFLRNHMVVDFNDAISRHYLNASKKSGCIKRIFYRIEGMRAQRYEKHVLASFKHFNIVTDRDRDAILANIAPVKNTVDFGVIPHGVKIPEQPVLLETKDQLLFLGNLDYAPNREAANYFFKHLWGPIRTLLPHVEIFFVGKGKHIPLGHRDPRVHFMGFIPDLTDIINNTTALVAPIISGGGIPSKIIEVMAYGVPVITTPTGAGSIHGMQNSENCLVIPETDSTAWATAIGRLAQDDLFRKKIGKNARQLIVDNYSSSLSQKLFTELFKKIIH